MTRRQTLRNDLQVLYSACSEGKVFPFVSDVCFDDDTTVTFCIAHSRLPAPLSFSIFVDEYPDSLRIFYPSGNTKVLSSTKIVVAVAAVQREILSMNSLEAPSTIEALYAKAVEAVTQASAPTVVIPSGDNTVREVERSPSLNSDISMTPTSAAPYGPTSFEDDDRELAADQILATLVSFKADASRFLAVYHGCRIRLGCKRVGLNEVSVEFPVPINDVITQQIGEAWGVDNSVPIIVTLTYDGPYSFGNPAFLPRVKLSQPASARVPFRLSFQLQQIVHALVCTYRHGSSDLPTYSGHEGVSAAQLAQHVIFAEPGRVNLQTLTDKEFFMKVLERGVSLKPILDKVVSMGFDWRRAYDALVKIVRRVDLNDRSTDLVGLVVDYLVQDTVVTIDTHSAQVISPTTKGKEEVGEGSSVSRGREGKGGSSLGDDTAPKSDASMQDGGGDGDVNLAGAAIAGASSNDDDDDDMDQKLMRQAMQASLGELEASKEHPTAVVDSQIGRVIDTSAEFLNKLEGSNEETDERGIVNILDGLLVFIADGIRNRLPTLHKYCVMCDHPPLFASFMLQPAVCSRALCCYTFQTLKVGTESDAAMAAGTSVIDLLVAMARAAALSQRRELVLDPFPTVLDSEDSTKFVLNPAQKDFDLLRTIMAAFPSMRDLSAVSSTAQIKDMLNDAHPAAFPLLKWIVASNRSHLVRLDEELRVKTLKTPFQYLLLSAPPEKEERFAALKKKHGTLFGYHGSQTENWHSILRVGLKNASGTALQLNGAAHGAGVYLSTSLQYSWGYSSRSLSPSSAASSSADPLADTFLDESNLCCIALCEAIDTLSIRKSNNIYVFPDPEHVVTRFLFVFCRWSECPPESRASIDPSFKAEMDSILQKLSQGANN